MLDLRKLLPEAAFTAADLPSRACVLWLDPNVQVPWDDLRYLFGEILYGGHIVEDWDRRLSSAYLNKHFTEALLESPELFPGFTPAPSNANHKAVGTCLSHWLAGHMHAHATA